MKSIKVFYHGKRLKDIYPYATKWEVLKYRVCRFMRRLVLVSATITVGGWLIWGGIQYGKHSVAPFIVQAQDVPVATGVKLSPVMQRIAKCESSAEQVSEKNGQIKYNVNTDKTIDIGYMQINSTHFAEATKLGYDLTKKEDNIAFAEHLYETQGTEPWYSSKSCWDR